jgi:16S rRNA (cytosine1402-N4)-methyltransferase
MDPDRDYKHMPVLVEEVVRAMSPQTHGIYVDATVGEGGHAEALLHALASSSQLIAIDRDAEVLEVARRRLAPFGSRVEFVHAHSTAVADVLATLRITQVDGVLLDLGVSSYQLETARRGFSFARQGPLDMRMDRSTGLNAATLVNTLEEWELVDIIRRYGEERWARRIARAIVRARRRAPVQTTHELALIVAQAMPSSARPSRIHPATRTFQALRIAVNQELSRLAESLTVSFACLRQRGRLCVIAYHSLEDRIVKRTFQALTHAPHNDAPRGRLLTRKPIICTLAERQMNPRARSAKLRVIERE